MCWQATLCDPVSTCFESTQCIKCSRLSFLATIPLTISLPLAPATSFLHAIEPRLAGLLLKTKTLEAHLFGDMGANPLVFLVQRGLMLALLPLDNGYFLGAYSWNPAHDFSV
jgi:hypothetical protein